MEDICRICLSSSVTLMDMFAQRTSAFDTEPSLVQKIMECARCDILEHDNLPQKICISCILNAESAYKFKRTCEQSQLILTSKLAEGVTNIPDQTIKIEATEIILGQIEAPEIILGQDSEITLKTEPENVPDFALEQKAVEHLEITMKEEEETMEIDSLVQQLPTKAVAKPKSTRQSQKTKVKESKVKNIRKTVICSTKTTKKARSKTPPTVIETEFGEFQCAQCLKVVGSANALRLHSMVHISDRPHECPHCLQRFIRKSVLQAHIRTHTGERPYKCEDCSMSFVQATHLIRHRRIHTEDFRFKCPQCPAKFVNQENFKSHLASHTNPQPKERPHECPHCLNRFTRKGDLQAHIRTHTGERPYKCEHCARSFIQATHLNQHKRTQHAGDLRYKCPECPAKFVKQGNLKCHLAFHTNPELKEVEKMMKTQKRQQRKAKSSE